MSGDCLLELSALATPQTMRKKMQSRDPRSEDNKDKTRERKMCVSGWRGCKQEGGERRRQGGSIARAHARTDYHKMNFTRVHELCTSCEMVSSEKRDWGGADNWWCRVGGWGGGERKAEQGFFYLLVEVTADGLLNFPCQGGK